MNEINFKDLDFLVKHMRLDMESMKRTLSNAVNRGDSRRYVEILEKRIERVEPVLKRVEDQLSNVVVNI